MFNPLSPHQLGDAAANVYDSVIGDGLADLRPTPRQIIAEAPQRTVYRYLPTDDRPSSELPTLLVPPLAAPAECFDLRRGCSLAAHLLAEGHATYLVEYGSIAFGDRNLGLEHWVDEVLPSAVQNVADDTGQPVQVVGWCLGGIMALLAVAARRDLPIQSIALVGSPFDFRRVPLAKAFLPLAQVQDGAVGTAIYKTLGGAPAPLVRRVFQLTSWDKWVTKPAAVAANLHDRDMLAQMGAVDHFMGNMVGYPGRSIAQMYHLFFRNNDLADGHILLGDREIDLGNVEIPVLAVAGAGDVLAPVAAVHAVADLLTGAPEVRLRTAPGGHLGVLTGRSAVSTTWVELDRFLRDHGAAEALPAASRRAA
ncbi:MAG: alpha/beta hydrolase [Solirubrobacteraceae bacterium]|nr:alpha/beta hydrolase [Solirubrobacteraceae bacterium]